MKRQGILNYNIGKAFIDISDQMEAHCPYEKDNEMIFTSLLLHRHSNSVCKYLGNAPAKYSFKDQHY